ncbi:MAG: peptidylprolyl isomerase [Siculibacillus sp.]|nr:peptidylprolyl isomerase [Siculibacillus sp.]
MLRRDRGRNWAPAFARILAGATLALVISTAGALAQSIKVVVNGEAITSNEIDTRARFLRMVDRTTTGASVQRAAVEELVEERLKLQEAKRVGMSVPQSQVDAAFGSIAARLKISPAQLAQGLSAQGISPETLKTRIRTQMVWQQLVMGRFSRQLKISDSQIVDALAKKDGGKGAQDASGGSTSEYTIQQVILIVRAQGGDAAARMREAETLRGRLSGCAGLVDAVKPIKESMVKSLGKRTADELPENFREELGKLEVGRLSKPMRGPIGIEMLMICDKREVAGDLSIRSKVEQDLRNQEGEVYSRRYLNDLRRIAVIEYKK